jgi:hypothetical protein
VFHEKSGLPSVGLPHAFRARSQSDEIDDFVQSRMQRDHIPGLTLAIVRKGHVLKTKGTCTHTAFVLRLRM